MFLAEFVHAETGLAVVIDDDGRVGSAYLRTAEGDVIGDVWLYNRGASPERVDWTDATLAPFPNPTTHARPLDRPLPGGIDDFAVRWTLDGELLLADVWLNGALLARLSPGAAPGWSALATQPGPRALPLPEQDDEAEPSGRR